MIHRISIDDDYLDGIARRDELPVDTVRRLLIAEKRRLDGFRYRPGKSRTARVHISEHVADVVDNLRRSYRVQTGLWPEQIT